MIFLISAATFGVAFFAALTGAISPAEFCAVAGVTLIGACTA